MSLAEKPSQFHKDSLALFKLQFSKYIFFDRLNILGQSIFEFIMDIFSVYQIPERAVSLKTLFSTLMLFEYQIGYFQEKVEFCI